MSSQFFPADNLAGSLEQHDQNLEGLILKPYLRSIAAKFPGMQIGLKHSELNQPRSVTARQCGLPLFEPRKSSRTSVFQVRHLGS
jgi:hypothetical protein